MRSTLALLFAAILLAPIQTPLLGQQDPSTASPKDGPEYTLPPGAVAAGIDGKVQVALTIKADGKAADVRILGGPMWPCGKDKPGKQIDAVQDGVKDHVAGMIFSPEVKDGKPQSVSAQITLLLTPEFRSTAADLPKSQQTLIDIGRLNRVMIDMPRFHFSGAGRAGILEMQVLVAEDGTVLKAGGFRGLPQMADQAFETVCKAKFRPATVGEKPVKFTGILTISAAAR